MKEIEEAAREYAINEMCFEGCDLKNLKYKLIIDATVRDFKAGVEFAQKWISVEDELPEEDYPVLTKIEFEGYQKKHNI